MLYRPGTCSNESSWLVDASTSQKPWRSNDEKVNELFCCSKLQFDHFIELFTHLISTFLPCRQATFCDRPSTSNHNTDITWRTHVNNLSSYIGACTPFKRRGVVLQRQVNCFLVQRCILNLLLSLLLTIAHISSVYHKQERITSTFRKTPGTNNLRLHRQQQWQS